jgi:LacI family transcriptional regulator
LRESKFLSSLTIGALRAIQEERLKVPEDISLIVFDDIPFPEYFNNPISEMGLMAVNLLIKQIQSGCRKDSLSIKIPTKLIRRKSVKGLLIAKKQEQIKRKSRYDKFLIF